MIKTNNALEVAIVALLFVAACTRDSGPAVVVADVRVLAPVAGSMAGVAYLTITNNGNAPISITNIRSPQFERVEIHETTIDDQGISRMRQRARVEIAADDVISFESGGLHLMLIGARPDTRSGSPITLEVEHDGGLLIVSATMQNLLPSN